MVELGKTDLGKHSYKKLQRYEKIEKNRLRDGQNHNRPISMEETDKKLRETQQSLGVLIEF